METTPKPAEAPPAKPKNRTMILIGIVIIVLIVVGVGAYELLNTGGGGPTGTKITIFDNGCSAANQCGFKDANGSNSTTITSGGSAYWTNTGALPHSATSCDSTNAAKYSYNCPQSNGSLSSFDVYTPTQGSSSGSVAFTTKGTYYYFCRVHPFLMHGAIVVR